MVLSATVQSQFTYIIFPHDFNCSMTHCWALMTTIGIGFPTDLSTWLARSEVTAMR